MSYCLLLSILPSEQIWYVNGILLFLSVRRIVTDDFEVDANPMMIVAGEVNLMINPNTRQPDTFKLRKHKSIKLYFVAGCAVVFNIVLGVLLHGAGHAHSHGGGSHTHKADEDGHSHGYHLNIRAALIHVLGDLIQSIGVLISSIIIKVHPGGIILDKIEFNRWHVCSKMIIKKGYFNFHQVVHNRKVLFSSF